MKIKCLKNIFKCQFIAGDDGNVSCHVGGAWGSVEINRAVLLYYNGEEGWDYDVMMRCRPPLAY